MSFGNDMSPWLTSMEVGDMLYIRKYEDFSQFSHYEVTNDVPATGSVPNNDIYVINVNSSCCVKSR